MADKWENGPHVLEEHFPGKLIYKVKPIKDSDGLRSHVFHRNMLYPIRSAIAVSKAQLDNSL